MLKQKANHFSYLLFLIFAIPLILGSHSFAAEEPDEASRIIESILGESQRDTEESPTVDDQQGELQRDDPPDSLSAAYKDRKHAIFFIGHGGVGSGSGALISRPDKDRILIVTNAHVADIYYMKNRRKVKEELFAWQNQTGRMFNVTNVYYHPGVVRIAKDRKLKLGLEYKDGVTFWKSQDIAILELELIDKATPWSKPEPFGLLSFEECKDLKSTKVGMAGFPGYNNEVSGWPTADNHPNDTYSEGVVSRMTDFWFKTGRSENEQRFLQHSARSWWGSSGSVIFNNKRQLVGIHNSGRHPWRKFQTIIVDNVAIPHIVTGSAPQGIRADSLWDMILSDRYENEKFQDYVIGTRDERVTEVFIYPELGNPVVVEKDLRFVNATANIANGFSILFKNAGKEFSEQDYSDVMSKTRDVDSLYPGYWPVHYLKSLAYFYDGYWNNEEGPERTAQYKLAYKSAEKAKDLYDSAELAGHYFVVACNYKGGDVEFIEKKIRDKAKDLLSKRKDPAGISDEEKTQLDWEEAHIRNGLG